MKIQHSCALAVALAAASVAVALPPAVNSAPHQRTFEVTYAAEVHDIPAGTQRVEIWLPYPQDDDYQTILDASVSSPYPAEILTAPQYRNTMVHIVVENPSGSIPVTMKFTVRRLEHVEDGFKRASVADGTSNAPSDGVDASPASLARWLEPDRLVPLDARIRELSAQVTAGKLTQVEKARAIYDYVEANMKYDKSGTGWGNGDIYWACDAKRGNCTDFHALFIGLARAAGIPAKFEIGLPLPADKASGEIAGYHCWIEFYLNGYGWIPVDASEGWKDPAKREYFFGAHDANRVQFSVGRDVVLAPRQAGAPLNYFIYPYVEADGKPFADVSRKFSFRDENAAPATSASAANASGTN